MSPIYTAPDQPPINWHAVSPTPTALVLLDWREGPGTTIAKRDAAGSLYGCRDVTEGRSMTRSSLHGAKTPSGRG